MLVYYITPVQRRTLTYTVANCFVWYFIQTVNETWRKIFFRVRHFISLFVHIRHTYNMAAWFFLLSSVTSIHVMYLGKMTRLTCRRGMSLRVVGVKVLGPPHVARCGHLLGLRRQIGSSCNGRRRCFISSRDLRLTRKQCPGVAAVFIDVSCTRPGGI